MAHFSVDNSLALVKRSAFIDKESEIMVGSEYQVKEGTKIYDAKIIEIGESWFTVSCLPAPITNL